MSSRRGKGRDKKEKKSPAKQRIGVEEAIRRLQCTLCDKTDCENKINCSEYKTTEDQVSEENEELKE